MRVLWISAVLGRGAISATFPVSVLAIKDLLGSETFAGLSTAASTVGSAVAAGALASYMRRHGRRSGLAVGMVAAAIGALLAILAIEADLLSLFLVAMVLIGAGMGTASLSRYVAADLAPPSRRSADIATVIFASTFGAVVFPLFLGMAGDVSEGRGMQANSGGFAMGLCLTVLAALVIWVFMRPDPLAVSGGVDLSGTARVRPGGLAHATAHIWGRPLARLAFVGLVISQAVMVMVMAMTPLHMEAHGHSHGVVGQVIAVHTAGMFAFAPLAGWISERIGRIKTVSLSGATLAVATVFTALGGEAPKLLMFPGLFLLGLGWSFGIVAASTLLTESVEEHERVGAQGAADTAKNIASGLGAISSGIVLDMSGFHILSMIGFSASLGLVAMTAVPSVRVARN